MSDTLGKCVNWTGYVAPNGYGKKGPRLAHRIAFERANGPIPAGMQIDHLCRNRRCVNPAHMEAVTQKENILRGEGFSAKNAKKTHCPKGHPYVESNLVKRKQGGWRMCATCNKDRKSTDEYKRSARDRMRRIYRAERGAVK